MYHIREHIISLVAVFLALGLGMLIGTGLSDDMLVTQQRLLIERMAKEFTEMRSEINRLETCIEEQQNDLLLWEKYQEALYPVIVPGMLTERKIAVICCGAGLPPEVMLFLKDARAVVEPVVWMDNKEKPAEKAEDWAETILDTLTKQSPRAIRKERSSIPEEERAVFQEEPLGEKPDTILFILGERDEIAADLLDLLLTSLNKEGLLLVGLEESGVKNSVLRTFKAAGISTIDNIDTVFGRFSLLSVLHGSRGNYGVKENADAFIATFGFGGDEP